MLPRVCLLVFGASLTAVAKERTLVFKNDTNRTIQFAIVYQDRSGQWMKSGWVVLGPKDSDELEDYFGGDKFHLYGTDVNANWDWPDQKKQEGLQQTVRSSSFNVKADVNLQEAAVYFMPVFIGAHERFTWTFR